MSNNPLIKNFFVFLTILTIVRFLCMHFLLIFAGFLISGAFAVTIWIISQDPKLTSKLKQKPMGKRWVNFVQNTSGVIPASCDHENGETRKIKLNMHEMYHFEEGERWIKYSLKGHDADIRVLFQNLELSIELYKRDIELDRVISKPIASYLILGPTGTGKTYCAELMSQLLYPEKGLLSIRMNELKNEHDVNTLLGSSTGVNGGNSNGILTRPVIQNPYRVVLFDEIDKCNPVILDSLYHILDIGKSRDKGSNKDVDFTNCIFFATANISSTVQKKLDIAKNKDLTSECWKKEVVETLTSDMGFEKSFLARFDHIFYFPQLDNLSVAEISLMELVKQYDQKGMNLIYTDPEIIVETISRLKATKDLGVRELKKVIFDMIKEPMIDALRKGISEVQLTVSDIGELSLINHKRKMEVKSFKRMSIAEETIMTLANEYKQYDLSLYCDDPEKVINAVNKLKTDRNLTAEELSNLIYRELKSQMLEAVQNDARDVELITDYNGNMYLLSRNNMKQKSMNYSTYTNEKLNLYN